MDFALSAFQRMDARAALSLLEGTGVSLESAARRALATAQKAERAVPLDEAVSTFLRRRREGGLRASTLDWYFRELTKVLDRWPDRAIDGLTRRELREYLESRVAGVRPAVFRVVRALCRFALQQEPPWLAVDPTRGMKFSPPRRDVAIAVLSVDQCRTLLAAAGPFRAGLALALFAGLRPEEIAGSTKEWLRWSAINEAERTIAISAALAKTRRPGVLTGLPDALWAWLATVTERGTFVTRSRFRQIARRGREVLGLAQWPKDVTRHTFASYATHFTRDPGQVALWLRHEGDQRVLYRHYRNVHVSEKEAQAFFALRP
jgi:integrase